MTVGAVATEHEQSTRAALSILRRGGNAMDAAVAAALVAGVVAPGSSGLGGGGFALLFDAAEHKTQFLDFRETAPKHFPAGTLDSRPLPSAERGRAIGVPGEPSGLYLLQRRYGRLAFATVVAEALPLASDGYVVGAHLSRVSQWVKSGEPKSDLAASLGYAKWPLRAGERVRMKGLAKTLSDYGTRGPPAIVEGPVAEELERTAQARGSFMTLEDLRDYAPVSREPLQAQIGRFRVVTAPPPSAGGLLLLQTLGKFTEGELRQLGNTEERIHLLAEAYRQSLADRFAYLGDPSYVRVPVARLLDAAYLAKRRQSIRSDQSNLHPVPLGPESGTSHLCVVDTSGNAVALTTTINNAFGSKLATPKSQILLNDELDDFGDSKGPNAPRPLARPVSSMTPTLVFEGDELRYVLGGSGGMTIATNVATALIALIADELTPAQALARPRFTLLPRTGEVELEESAPEAWFEGLGRRGEQVRKVGPGISAVQILARGPAGWMAAADPRKHGSAAVR